MGYKNIVLTGIMGSGKTTAGRTVAEKLNMEFLDLDQYIEQRWGPIPSLFKLGETHFRNIESIAAAEAGEREGLVIATGGGVVKRQENIDALKKKGLIFFIDRPLDDILSDINISERPLLKDGKEKLITIFHERYELYLNTCDIHIKNAKKLQDVAEEIIRIWNEKQKNRFMDI